MKVETYLVFYAVQALAEFCKRYGVKFPLSAIVEFTIALREGERYEWTPSATAFCRIITGSLIQQEEGRHFLVFGYDSFDERLSVEVNEAIRRATNGRWFSKESG